MPKITTIHRGDMLFESQVGEHKVMVDVPPNMGGSNRGPTPPEFFIASLGSCVAALVADYMNRVNLDTTGLTVDVDFEKADDPTRLKDVKVRINLPEGVNANGREKAILRVAEHCPVHETICSMATVDIELNGHRN